MPDRVLQLEDATKRYGDVTALNGVSLAARRGELLAVVGPSGCGKTTLLHVIAGLTDVDAGRVTIGGRVVAGAGAWVPPEDRRVGIVFQEHALFPHLTVADNVSFGLPRGAGRRARCAEALDLVHLAHMGDRYPHELSGGEQQRVALARALGPRPTVVLLDEPFSNLDANLRVRLRRETAAVLRASGTTAVFVTHDRQEALSIGDRVAVLNDGRLEQVDRPEVVFHVPRTRFVATFIGEADLLAGEVRGCVADTVVGALPVTGVDADGRVDVMVRPHEVVVEIAGDANATVGHGEFRGAHVLHVLVLDGGGELRCEVPHTRALEEGARVRVSVDASHLLAAFPAAYRPAAVAPIGTAPDG
ncbi:MAG TPA: ABC transporter ATP-binding protein [Euzebyales bacterium]|nr:ABC transporter ATP-binding protein [Euzebyales bacterium]